MAITDHVPPVSPGSARGPAARPPLVRSGVLRLPGLEFSPDRNHCLVLGLDPQDVPDPRSLPGWPDPSSYLDVVRDRAGVACFAAHPDDAGNSFLKVRSYPWDRWDLWAPAKEAALQSLSGLEVWNLSTDWSRHINSYADVIRAEVSGFFRAVPPPNPATLTRWDTLARWRPVAAVAGTDAHAYPARWHGLRLTILPYAPSFLTLQMAVRVPWATCDESPGTRARAVIKALAEGRSFIVNRVWGHPSTFTFEAHRLDGVPGVYGLGDIIPAGTSVRFDVNIPWAAWIRLVRDGQVMVNSYGREVSFEPLPAPAGGALEDSPQAAPPARQEAWRVEVWANATHWTRAGSGWFLWILTNFIYRALE